MKKKTRLKLTARQTAIATRADLEALVREVAELTLTRNKQQTELDAALTKIRQGYEETLAVIDQSLTEKTELARAWAEANPAEFKGLKSLELTHGTVGFRASTKVKTLAGWTVAKIIAALKAKFAFPDEYIRTKEELNKEALIAHRDAIPADELRLVGVKIVQDESFFIDPNIEPLENRQTHKQAA